VTEVEHLHESHTYNKPVTPPRLIQGEILGLSNHGAPVRPSSATCVWMVICSMLNGELELLCFLQAVDETKKYCRAVRQHPPRTYLGD
jgi:hypothetical protein